MYVPVFKNLFLLERKIYTEKEGKKDLPSPDLLPSGRNGQRWAQSKAWSQ